MTPHIDPYEAGTAPSGDVLADLGFGVREPIGSCGSYSVERECPLCGYRTWSRDDYWRHRFDAHEDDASPGEST